MRRLLFSAVLALILAPVTAQATPQFLGPTPYLCFDATTTTASGSCGTSDSPFADESFAYFYLEDFEDGALDTPGVVAGSAVNFGIGGPGIFADSVDEDDGAIDGSGQAGRSIFADAGSIGITFTFDENALGVLPTHVGIVWTDGSEFINIVTLEAFDGNGDSLGTFSSSGLGDGSFSGGTAEDRFFGVIDMGGIGSIHVSNNYGNRGIEFDHLQYGVVPEPSTGLLLGLGLVALQVRSRLGRIG